MHDHVPQVVQAALQPVQPGRGALQPVRRADVEHQEPVDEPDQFGVGQVLGQQVRVARGGPAVPADVQVPAGSRRDHPEVLALRLRALARTAGHRRLELVRGAQAPVAQLQVDGHPHAVLDPVPAPGLADAGLHRAQRLPVRVAGLEPGLDEPGPDPRELVDAGAEEVDALAAGDLRVEPEVAGDLADHDELVGGDLAAGDARDDRVRAVALQVREEVVVGVLEGGLLPVEDVSARAEGGGERGDDRADGRLADLAAVAAAGRLPAVAVEELLVRGQPTGTDDLVELRAGEGEAVAQPFVRGRGQQLADHLEAAAAAGARLRALLDLGERGAGGDRLLGDVVAGADHRGVGERGGAERHGCADAGGQDQLVGADGRDAAGERAQQAVRVGVADQDPAEQHPVGGDDQLLVDAGAGVGVDDVEAALGGAVGVAEGGHVHTEQLELGGEVGAGELLVAAQEVLGGGFGHLVAGGDQSVDAAVGGQRAFADGVDARVGGAAAGVDADAAALADGQARVAGELVAGADPGGEDDEVGVDGGAVGEPHPADVAVLADDDLLGADAGVDRQPHRLDGAQQRRAAAVVDLDGHQARGELHDAGGEAETLEGAGRLQPEEPAADDRAAGPGLRVLLDREQVLDGAVDEAAGGVLAGDGRHEGVAAGRQDEYVVREHLSGAGGDGTGVAVDGLGGVAEVQLDPVLLHEAGGGEGEVLGGASGEVRGEVHPVVGRPGLLTEHGDPVRGRGPALGECLEVALADHAVADEHDGGSGRGRGCGHDQEPPSSVSRWNRSVRSSASSQLRARAPTLESSPRRTPPTRRSPRTTTFR